MKKKVMTAGLVCALRAQGPEEDVVMGPDADTKLAEWITDIRSGPDTPGISCSGIEALKL
jgi:hypothetical protein